MWFGWQADVLPGNNRMTLTVPVAHNIDGSAITGLVRSEIVVTAPATSVNLSTDWFTGLSHASYRPVSMDNKTALADGFLPTLTVRTRENAPRVAIPNTTWNFGDCEQTKVDYNKICYPSGFQPGINTNCSTEPRTRWSSALVLRWRATSAPF